MKVTIIRNSESLPGDVGGGRLWRSGLHAKWLYHQGHSVSWYTSSFDHYNSVNREHIKEFAGANGLHETINLIHTRGYKNSISVSRFVDHSEFALRCFKQLMKADPPDIIICSFPTPESSFLACLYGRIKGVPVLLDIRDKWPDVFYETQTSILKLIISRLLLLPYSILKAVSMKMATHIIAANEDFLTWGLKAAGREINNGDAVSYIPFEVPMGTADDVNKAEAIYQSITSSDNDIVVTFAGTVGQMFDFDCLHALLSHAESESINLKIIICGRGSALETLRSSFSYSRNIAFTGQLSASVVFALLQRSSLLLAPYKNLNNFRNHLPNKFMEYIASGRPLLSSLEGYAKGVIDQYDIGTTYTSSAELCDAISRYIDDLQHLEIQAKNAKRLYDEKFHPSVILSELTSHLQSIVDARDNSYV